MQLYAVFPRVFMFTNVVIFSFDRVYAQTKEEDVVEME